MRDVVTSLIGTYDVASRYFDRNAIEQLKSYFDTGTARVQAAATINANCRLSGQGYLKNYRN